jgi:hypothetical protein
VAARINATGYGGELLPRDGVAFTLEELQHVVGGYIEAVYLRDGWIMMINEEGKLLGLPYNVLATHLARTHGSLSADDYIVGDVVVGTPQEMGEHGDDEAEIDA